MAWRRTENSAHRDGPRRDCSVSCTTANSSGSPPLLLNELVRLAGVRLVGASDSFDSASEQSKILLSIMATMHEMQLDQNASHVKRGMGDASEQGRLVQPPGFGYRLVLFVDANGNPVKTRKGTDAKRAEINPEEAAWIVRGAEMIAHEGKSPADVAKLFNAEKVSGKATWSDVRVRRLCYRERLVGEEVLRKTKQVCNRETGHVDVIQRDRDPVRSPDACRSAIGRPVLRFFRECRGTGQKRGNPLPGGRNRASTAHDHVRSVLRALRIRFRRDRFLAVNPAPR